MELLKSLEKRNKIFKRHLKKMGDEIDKRTETNPMIDNFQESQPRRELDQENILDKLMDDLKLMKDQQFDVCAQASSAFSRTIAQAKQSLGNGCSSQVKRPRLSQTFGGTFSISSSRLNALNNLSSESFSDRTFVKCLTNRESAASLLNRTIAEAKVDANRKATLNKTTSKASLKREDSKQSAMNRKVTKEAPAGNSTLLNQTITYYSTKDNQSAALPLKKIVRPVILPIADPADASTVFSLNKPKTICKTPRVPSEANKLPADSTNSNSTILRKSRSDSTLSKTRKKTKNETILNEPVTMTRSRSQSKLSGDTTLTAKPTGPGAKQAAESKQGSSDLQAGNMTFDHPSLLGTSLLNYSTNNPNLTAVASTPCNSSRYNLRGSVRTVKKNYAC